MTKRSWWEKRVETKDDWLTEWYWRKKYNSAISELELLKEVMRDDVYKQVIKKISEPLELARYKRENSRLRRLLDAAREERNNANEENKRLKKIIQDIGGGKVNGKKKRRVTKQPDK